MLIYYKSKLCAYYEPKNLALAYNLINQVYFDLNKVVDNKIKEQFLEEDLTFYFANNFKQNVCLLILDSIEKNSTQLLNGYKSFIKNFSCEINDKVKYKIDSLEFLTLRKDSNISICEKYLNENNFSAFKNEISSIIEYKTYEFLRTNIHLNETYQNFINKFPNSIFIGEIKYRLFESKINKATLINDTNALNNFEVEVAQIGTISYIKKIKALIESSKEKINYLLCENNKDPQLIDAFLNTYKNSLHFERVSILKDSINKAENQITAQETEEYEFPEIIKLDNYSSDYEYSFKDYYTSNLISGIAFNDARNFKNGYASISRWTQYLYDGKQKWSFINKKGEIITDYIFDETHDFSENMAAVKTDGLWGFIDTNGKQVINCKYQSVKDFKHGKAVVTSLTGGSFYINKNGIQLSPEYNVAFPFCNNKRAIIKPTIEDSYYYIDDKFNKLRKFDMPEINSWYKIELDDYTKGICSWHDNYSPYFMYDVTDNLTYVASNDNVDLVDSNDVSVNFLIHFNEMTSQDNIYKDELVKFPCKNNIYIRPTNRSDYFIIGRYYNFTNGYSYATKVVNKVGKFSNLELDNFDYIITDKYIYWISDNNEFVEINRCRDGNTINKKYISRKFHDGFCAVRNHDRDNAKWGFINEVGELLGGQLKYEDVTDFKNGFAIIKLNNKMGIINRKSNLVGEKIWDNVSFFSKYYFKCSKEDKQVIIDTNGIEVSQFFDKIGTLIEGYSIVSINGNLGFIDSKGKLIIKPFPFESLIPFHNGLSPAKIKGKWGFIDITGKFVLAPIYLKFIQFMVNDGFALVRGEDKFISNYQSREPAIYIIDQKGKKIREVLYKN